MFSNQKCKIIAVSGRPATGKTSVCTELIPKLKEKFPKNDIIYLDSNILLSCDELYKLPLEYKQEIEKLKNSGKLKYNLNPKIMADLLNSFMEENNHPNDIIIYYRGPQSVDVASLLNFKPDLYIYLDAPKEDLIERVCKRRVDLVSGKTYHLTLDAEFIKKNSKSLKLSQRIGDSEELFIPRIGRSDKYMLPVLEYYKNLQYTSVDIINCDGKSPRKTVFENVYNSCCAIIG